MILLGRIENGSIFITIIQKLVWLVLVLAIVSTIFFAFSPLLPTSDEYEGTFPEKFWENLVTWTSKTLWRHFMLFQEYYSFFWILGFLSNIFFLLLLLNIKKTISDYGSLKSEKLIGKYFDWAVSSLLITIVFITKYVTIENIIPISLGILGITVSIFILLYYATIIEPQKPKKTSEPEKKRDNR